MKAVNRSFGTDLSNIPSAAHNKGSKKSNPVTKSHNAKHARSPKKIETPSKPLFEVMETLMETLVHEIIVDDEITIRTTATQAAAGAFRYERDFLMSFQKFCVEPIEGLIPEVIPGYVSKTTSSGSLNSLASAKNAESDTTSSKIGFSSTQIDRSTSAVSATSEVVPSKGFKLAHSNSMDQSAATSSRSPIVKKEKPKESDEKRLAARQKQLDIGMNTDGYRRFIASISEEHRTKTHPKMPDIHQVCSKRSWDGQVRKWRRQLHDYDPAGQNQTEDAVNDSEEEDSSENEEELEKEVSIADAK